MVNAMGRRGMPSQALITACDCRFDLVMSVYVTDDRWDPDPLFDKLHHRFSRFEVFLYALRSYAPLPLEHVYLYVELDKRFESRRAELRSAAQQLFGKRLITLQSRRLTTQSAWREELAATIAPPRGALGSDEADRLIWFLQSDDHIFVDLNQDVLCEGLARMRADNSRFKTLFMSHWASALNLAGKVNRPVQRGAYIVSKLTQVDSVQVMWRTCTPMPVLNAWTMARAGHGLGALWAVCGVRAHIKRSVPHRR